DPADCPPLARRIATDFRICDAASRGAWGEVLRIGTVDLRPSPTSRFVLLAARRLCGHPADRMTLWRAWLRAPRRARTWSLLRRALGAPTRPRVDHHLELLSANDGGATERRAVSLHHETMGVAAIGILQPEHLIRLGRAWDTCLDDWAF